MNKSKLSNVILYSKNWYKKTNTVTDLQSCLTADGYSGEFFFEKEIAQLLLSDLDKLKLPNVNLFAFNKYISDSKINTNEQYDKAVIDYCLSRYTMLENEYWEPTKPNKQCLPLARVHIKDVFGVLSK
jgi:hypothetical protein